MICDLRGRRPLPARDYAVLSRVINLATPCESELER